MENRFEKSYGGVICQMNRAIEGVRKLGAELQLRLVDAAVMQADLEAFIAAEDEVRHQKILLMERRVALRERVSEGRRFLFVARDVLKPHLGLHHSVFWCATGFKRSLRVPREGIPMAVLLAAMNGYFTANPTHENAPLNVTAARASALYDALCVDRSAVDGQTCVWQQAISARDKIRARLRLYFRSLVKELTVKLSPSDPRWNAFGLNLPAHQPTPATPENVQLTIHSENVATLKWDKTPRATEYSVWIQVMEQDEEPRRLDKTSERSFMFENLPSDVEVHLSVSAANKAGESACAEFRVKAAMPRTISQAKEQEGSAESREIQAVPLSDALPGS